MQNSESVFESQSNNLTIKFSIATSDFLSSPSSPRLRLGMFSAVTWPRGPAPSSIPALSLRCVV